MTGTGIRRECVHPRAQHQHGSHVTYKRDGCRCDPCAVAAYQWRKRRDYERASGRGTMTSPDPARKHVEQLLEAGLTVGQVEARSGVHRTAIRVLLGDFPGRKRAGKITKTTEARLLSVGADRLGPERHGLVDRAGTARRVQALVANGWSMTLLAGELGLSASNFDRIVYGDTSVRAATRQAAVMLYDRLWDQQPPHSTPGQKRTASRSRSLANRLGWPPPLAWDDDTIDDPAAVPAHDLQPAGPKPHRKGRPPSVDPEKVELLLELGLPRLAIALELRVQPGTLQTALQRAGRRDLWLRLVEAERIRRDVGRAA